MKTVLQVALDFVDLERAMKCAEEAVKAGADWVEAGTPLIKSEGLNAIRKLRARFPQKTIVADMKIMDAGRTEVEIAAKAGANVVCALGAASDATLKECVEAAHNYGAKIQVDLIAIKDVEKRALEVERLGVDYIGVHCAIDEQMQAKDPFRQLKRTSKNIHIPIAIAGGINSETAPEAVRAGASIIIVGGAINKAKDAMRATQDIKKAILSLKGVKTDLFKRGSEKDLRDILTRVSTANISDAMHRTGDIKGLKAISARAKILGTALTVRTYPGDWAKTVEAVDIAKRGQVIVIDAGGVGPAVWGELATHGAIQKGISGVVIFGAIRDVSEIRRLRFSAFAKLVTPRAGEPKGLGEIGVPIEIEGTRVFTGDYIVGDDDGIVVIPEKRAVEIANRAMSVMEMENRLRKEIDEGSTLGKTTQLLKWEKQQ